MEHMSDKETTKAAYNTIAASYKEAHGEQDYWVPDREFFSTLIQGETPELLDLGCGPGLEDQWLAKKIPGAKITGVDFSEEMITLAHASSSERITFVLGDIATYRHPQEVQGIWARASFHHLNDEELDTLFTSIGTYLATGGVISMANKWGQGSEVEYKKRYAVPVSRYFNYFDEEKVEGICQKYGYRLEKQYRKDKDTNTWLISVLVKV